MAAEAAADSADQAEAAADVAETAAELRRRAQQRRGRHARSRGPGRARRPRRRRRVRGVLHRPARAPAPGRRDDRRRQRAAHDPGRRLGPRVGRQHRELQAPPRPPGRRAGRRGRVRPRGRVRVQRHPSRRRLVQGLDPDHARASRPASPAPATASSRWPRAIPSRRADRGVPGGPPRHRGPPAVVRTGARRRGAARGRVRPDRRPRRRRARGRPRHAARRRRRRDRRREPTPDEGLDCWALLHDRGRNIPGAARGRRRLARQARRRGARPRERRVPHAPVHAGVDPVAGRGDVHPVDRDRRRHGPGPPGRHRQRRMGPPRPDARSCSTRRAASARR